jgi:hypothetical protein
MRRRLEFSLEFRSCGVFVGHTEINLNCSPNSIPTDCHVGKYYQTNMPNPPPPPAPEIIRKPQIISYSVNEQTNIARIARSQKRSLTTHWYTSFKSETAVSTKHKSKFPAISLTDVIRLHIRYIFKINEIKLLFLNSDGWGLNSGY